MLSLISFYEHCSSVLPLQPSRYDGHTDLYLQQSGVAPSETDITLVRRYGSPTGDVERRK